MKNNKKKARTVFTFSCNLRDKVTVTIIFINKTIQHIIPMSYKHDCLYTKGAKEGALSITVGGKIKHQSEKKLGK